MEDYELALKFMRIKLGDHEWEPYEARTCLDLDGSTPRLTYIYRQGSKSTRQSVVWKHLANEWYIVK